MRNNVESIIANSPVTSYRLRSKSDLLSSFFCFCKYKINTNSKMSSFNFHAPLFLRTEKFPINFSTDGGLPCHCLLACCFWVFQLFVTQCTAFDSILAEFFKNHVFRIGFDLPQCCDTHVLKLPAFGFPHTGHFVYGEVF